MDYKNMCEDDLQKIIGESHSWNEVLQKCGLKTMTRSFQRNVKKYDIKCDHLNDYFDGLYTKFNKKTKEEMEEIVRNASDWLDIITGLGYRSYHNVPKIKNKLDKMNISYSHIKKEYPIDKRTGKYGYSGKAKYDLNEILIEDSMYSNMKWLFQRLKNERGWEHKCSVCGLLEWNGKPIPLEIDHINGVHSDNRIENIRAICPNCHAQTHNYKGKNMQICKSKPPPSEEPKEPQEPKPPNLCTGCNKEIMHRHQRCNQCNAKHKFETGVARKVQDRPSYEQLLDDIANMSIVKVGQKYGVSDNAIRKWIRKYEKYDETAKT